MGWKILLTSDCCLGKRQTNFLASSTTRRTPPFVVCFNCISLTTNLNSFRQSHYFLLPLLRLGFCLLLCGHGILSPSYVNCAKSVSSPLQIRNLAPLLLGGYSQNGVDLGHLFFFSSRIRFLFGYGYHDLTLFAIIKQNIILQSYSNIVCSERKKWKQGRLGVSYHTSYLPNNPSLTITI